MRILIYAGGMVPVGGIEAFIHDIAAAMQDAGHQLRLVCWGPPTEQLHRLTERGADIRRSSFRWGCRLALPDFLRLPGGLIALRDQDLVLFTKVPPSPVLWALRGLSAKLGRPPFVYVTAYRPSEMWSPEGPSHAVLDAFDAIIVQVATFRNDLQRFGYRGRVAVIPLLPPDPGPATPFPDTGTRLRLGFLGRLVPQKDVSALLQVFAHLCHTPTGGNWELHLFGDGPDRARLEALAHELAIGESVTFHGSIERDLVPSAIDSCHMFAFTSRSEGQCLAALEILARGRPVIATPVGAFPDLLSHSVLGEVCPVDDPAHFASLIEKICASIALSRLAPQEVQDRFKRKFSREVIAKKYVSFFDSLI